MRGGTTGAFASTTGAGRTSPHSLEPWRRPTELRDRTALGQPLLEPRIMCNNVRRDCGRIINYAPRLRMLQVLQLDRALRRFP